MATKFTQAQRDEWIDIQMRKAEVLEAIDTLEVVEPEDIEASRQEEIDTVEAQILAIYEEKLVISTILRRFSLHTDKKMLDNRCGPEVNSTRTMQNVVVRLA